MRWLRKILGIEQQSEKIDMILDRIETSGRSGIKEDEPIKKSDVDYGHDFQLVDPLDLNEVLFSFKVFSISEGKRQKIDADTLSILRNLGSSIPELASAGLLTQSYRFIFPKGISGSIMELSLGQGTAVMGKAGKILGHGAYASNLVIAAPFIAISIGSTIVRQHYLAKINDNLNQINNKVSQLLELEFIKKHAKIESLALFVTHAHQDYSAIEYNKEYRSAYLANIIRVNSEILELIIFFTKSFKLLVKSDPAAIELNLRYYRALHFLFIQGKLLELKYAQEYNKALIANMQAAFERLNHDSIAMLKNHQMDLYRKILATEESKGFWEWARLSKKKDIAINTLTAFKDNIVEAMLGQQDELKAISDYLSELQYNIGRRQEFIIENGEMFEIVE